MVRQLFSVGLVLSVTSLALLGCADRSAERSKTATAPATPAPAQANDEDSIRTNLDQLSAEDRKLADEQRFCAVENKNRLGSMGVPVKVMVKDQPVFLCCSACRTKALAHADRTLAKVKELKEQKEATPAK
jgi:hypothetical protein